MPYLARLVRFSIFVCLLTLLLLMTGCLGTPAAPTNAPTQMPLAVEVTGLDASAFRVEATGAITFSFTDFGYFIQDPVAGTTLVLAYNGADPQIPSGSSITLVFPANTAAGTYTIGAYNTAFDEQGAIIAVGASFASLAPMTDSAGATPDPSNTVTEYGDVTRGVMTLENVQTPTGSFTFTLNTEQGEFTINGTFNQLAFGS